MKKTKNMYIDQNRLSEAFELQLFIENNYIFNNRLQDIEKNLIKKNNKGIYSREKATLLYMYIVNDASKLYIKQYGGYFDVTTRYTAAHLLEDAFYYDNIKKINIV